MTCSEEVNIFRLTQDGRQANHKLVDKDLLIHIRDSYQLFQPQEYELVMNMDTSDLSEQESSDQILSW
jgi:hypothetical protein